MGNADSVTQSVAPVGSQTRDPAGAWNLGTGTAGDDDAYGGPEASWRGHSVDHYDEPGTERRPLRWNAGTDLGLLILRLALGGTFLAHGAQKLFGVLGGPGAEGFARTLRQLGFRESTALSLVTGAVELGGGALLILGLFTPLAAAGLIGVMVNAVAMKYGSGFFASSGGMEYEIVLGCLGLGLLFTGPGRIALDNGRWWFRRPLAAGFVGLLMAAVASTVVLFLFHGTP